MNKYRCTVCNFIYDVALEKKSFDDLPDSYTCPVCGAPKSAFIPEGSTTSDKSIHTTVAEKLVEQLVAFGVKHVYGIPGDSNLPVVEAIRKNDKIEFILTRHEETAAFMACAHGKMTDHLGVCMSIAGPGSTNLITGLMDATNDRSPVLALLGQVPELYLGSEAFQEIDQIELFRPFAQYGETVARANQALKLVLMAAKYAYKRPGVSILSMPTDVLVEKLAEKVYEPKKRIVDNPVLPQIKDIKRAAALINKSKKVAILAGWGARHSGQELLGLAQKIKGVVATTSRAKGLINETHELSVGVLGSIGAKHAAKAVQGCDLLIIIGTGFRQANLIPANIMTIQIDWDTTRTAKTFDLDIGLIGEAKVTLEKLADLVDEKPGVATYLNEVAKFKKQHLKEIETDAKDMTSPINPGLVIQTIKKHVDSDAIICVDVGDHTYWFYKKFVCEGQRTYLSANIASMGFSLPAALAAQLDFPDKQVVCVTGDGGFAMLMADFTTAVRQKLPISVVVFNDGALKNIKKEQNRDDYPEYGITFKNPNFAEFAKSSGGLGIRVNDPHKLDAAIKKAFLSTVPALVEVIVDREKMAASTKSPA
ncbi:MAG TPA: thiamine pyrophosphate-binding protein [Actinobacteria bacterium]|nr:thiamine pyrophosphate-binding protein [Actinomycetota bacterium]